MPIFTNKVSKQKFVSKCRKYCPALKTDLHVELFPKLLYPLHQTAIAGSIFMTVAIAFERYTAVHFPMNYNQVSTKLVIIYLVQLIEQPISRIPNFNFTNLRCCKVFLFCLCVKSYIGIFLAYFGLNLGLLSCQYLLTK